MAHWVTWSDGSEGCVEVAREKLPSQPTDVPKWKDDPEGFKQAWAKYNAEYLAAIGAQAETLKPGLTVTKVQPLPYPASPRLGPDVDKNFPSFCWQPKGCAGYSSCPRPISCTE